MYSYVCMCVYLSCPAEAHAYMRLIAYTITYIHTLATTNYMYMT